MNESDQNSTGYIPPEEMIDHNHANFSQIENVMTIFVAYNQANIQQGTPWDTWPEWELCLTAMNPEIHFENDDDSDETKALRAHWLSVMQFIHDNEFIKVDEYTIEVQGQHGAEFSFDISFESEVWIGPGEFLCERKDQEQQEGNRKPTEQPRREDALVSCFCLKNLPHNLRQIG